jgi:hypothetical protein
MKWAARARSRSEKVIAHHGDENKDLSDQCARGDPKRREKLLQLPIVLVPKSVEVVREPAIHLREVVANRIEALVEASANKRENESVPLREQDVHARADRKKEGQYGD